MVFINVTDTPGSRPGRVVQLIPPFSHLLAGGGSDSSEQVNLNKSLFRVIKHTQKVCTNPYDTEAEQSRKKSENKNSVWKSQTLIK